MQNKLLILDPAVCPGNDSVVSPVKKDSSVILFLFTRPWSEFAKDTL